MELLPHWSYLGWSPVITAAVAAAVVSLAMAWTTAPSAVVEVGLGIVGVTGLWLAARVARWRTTSLVITTTRLVRRSGVLARRGLDIRLDRINEVSYHQSLAGRMARTGALQIEVGGEAGVVVLDHVRRPAAVAGVVHEQIAALGRSARERPDDTPPAGLPAMPADPVPRRTVGERLVELEDLRRRGILTESEFADKRAKLLDRL